MNNFTSKQFIAGSCHSYILSSQNEAVIIDPHISLEKEYELYLKKNNLTLKFILDTHTHADHFSLAAVLKKKYSIPLFMHEKAISEITDKRLKDNDEIAFGSQKAKILYTPGHTDDAISIYVNNNLYTGDVLLIGGIGRTDFQNGSPESMFDTLVKLKQLPEKTQIFPGHDYHGKHHSILEIEKNKNPFLKESDKLAFTNNLRSKSIPKPFNIDNIIRVNRSGQAVLLGKISAKDAHSIIEKDSLAKIIDVRTIPEFQEKHIKDSINIPLGELNLKINELNLKTDNHLLMMCHSGNRAAMAADMLIQSGFPNIKIVEGGMLSWEKANLPIIKENGNISLERQVRIAAGTLILLGLAMTWLIAKFFIIIPIFICCGLIYSGISNNCLMAMLLMKLPFNKKFYKPKASGGTCEVT